MHILLEVIGLLFVVTCAVTGFAVITMKLMGDV